MTRVLNAARRAGSAQVIESIADQVVNATNTYIDGSSLPFSSLDARTSLRWRLWLSKTAAGVAAPVIKVVSGPLATIADTARLTFTGPAQTAAADAAYIEILALLRSAGGSTSAVLNGVFRMTHNLDATGFAVLGTPTILAESAGFDSTIRDVVAGLTIDPGAAGVWTIEGIIAEVVNT
jgi:hypothetical protein